MNFFTSDPHYGHHNILEYCKRPFSSVNEMDEVMIKRWNERVTKNDVVYVLGDFIWPAVDDKRAYDILHQLNGDICLIPGSHDSEEHCELYEEYGVDIMSNFYTIRGKKSEDCIVLCHYAMRTWPLSHHGSIHLYGHSHGELPSQGLSFDVGVDAHDFYPWAMNEVLNKIKELREQDDSVRQSKL